VSEIVGEDVGAERGGANGPAPEPELDGPRFGAYYFQHDCGRPYERDDVWLAFFAGIADQLIERLHPTSVLDAGCAWGFLVEALRARGVDAWGVDVSEYAIDHVDDSVKEYCWRGSLVEPLPRRYDLVTCIEVIEHMPPHESDIAIANLCAASDRVLLSSTPGDYSEPTHLNVQPPENWSAAFARRGFVRDVDFDGSFITPWAVLYVRSDKPLPEVVRAYERVYSRVNQEQRELRDAILELHARLEALTDDPDARDRTRIENLRIAEELLASRDTVISHEVRLGDAMAEVRRLEAELVRYQDRIEQLDQILGSWSWRVGGALHRLARRLRGRSR
jgi:Methyltransferase domain